MQQAMVLAEQGRGFVEPNPLVGCLIVKDGNTIGKGFHQRFGGPHAEINALADCQQSPEGATAIVTLEPCCHHGKTPPCSAALIEAGISKVIIGLQDPNPLVDGGGIAQLKNAGIEVQTGFLAKELALQNAGFIKLNQTKKPWVVAKYAMTLDGNLATDDDDSKWISNEACRKQVHLHRSQIDAIMVGSNTVVKDDPQLTVRLPDSEPSGLRQPLRVVVDSKAAIPLTSQLVTTARLNPVLVVVDPEKAEPDKITQLTDAGVEILAVRESYGKRLETVLLELGKRDITNMVVEGGSRLLGEFLESDQIDELRIYLAPTLIGSGRQPFASPHLSKIADGNSFEILRVEELDGNLYVRGLLNKSLFSNV